MLREEGSGELAGEAARLAPLRRPTPFAIPVRPQASPRKACVSTDPRRIGQRLKPMREARTKCAPHGRGFGFVSQQPGLHPVAIRELIVVAAPVFDPA